MSLHRPFFHSAVRYEVKLRLRKHASPALILCLFHLVNLTQIQFPPVLPGDRLWIEATWRPLTRSALVRRRECRSDIWKINHSKTCGELRASCSKTDLFLSVLYSELHLWGSSFITALKGRGLKIGAVLRKYKSPDYECNITFRKRAAWGLNFGNLRKMLP